MYTAEYFDNKIAYHDERVREESKLITYLLQHYTYGQQSSAIQRARKRRKYHQAQAMSLI